MSAKEGHPFRSTETCCRNGMLWKKLLHKQQTQTTSTTHDPTTTTVTTQLTTHDQTPGTTKIHDQKRTRHQGRRHARRRYATHPLSIKRQLNLRHTKASTSSTLWLLMCSFCVNRTFRDVGGTRQQPTKLQGSPLVLDRF